MRRNLVTIAVWLALVATVPAWPQALQAIVGDTHQGGGGSSNIAFDASACSGTDCAFQLNTGGASFNFTTSGTNRAIGICLTVFRSDSADPAITSVQFDGVDFTAADSVLQAVGATHTLTDCRYLVNPTLGTKSLTWAYSGSTNNSVVSVASYTGVAQTGTLDSHACSTDSTASSYSQATTVVNANSWLFGVMWGGGGGTPITAGAGTTIRKQDSAGANGIALADSNGGVAAGSRSLAYTFPSGQVWGACTLSFKST